MMNYEEKNITESLEHRLSATFVGRSKQMEQLSTLLERTVKGAGCFVLVSGEAGTGKSTLIRQFSTYAANSGVTFISENLGRVHSFEPYTPFLRMIAKLGGSKIDSLMERVGATEENAPTAARAGGGNRSPLWNSTNIDLGPVGSCAGKTASYCTYRCAPGSAYRMAVYTLPLPQYCGTSHYDPALPAPGW